MKMRSLKELTKAQEEFRHLQDKLGLVATTATGTLRTFDFNEKNLKKIDEAQRKVDEISKKYNAAQGFPPV